MNTPICDFLRNYAASGAVRAHMPGHKGVGCGSVIDAVLPYDITEIDGADSLFEASGIIAESEKNASTLFKTAATVYSAGGSTLCIEAIVRILCMKKGKIVAARNAHRSFINACILMGAEVEWIVPKSGRFGSSVSCEYDENDVENAILSAGEVAGVYVTSPDYLGKLYRISEIAEVCAKYGIKLAVDNAHGAHLAFLRRSRHPIAMGADICCDSAHKSLPVLTGGAYLHFADASDAVYAKESMGMFGSTSPSYPIMASLDYCNAILADGYTERLEKAVSRLNAARKRIAERWDILDGDPLKITVNCGGGGKSIAKDLEKDGIFCEYADKRYIVFMFSTENYEDADKLADCFEKIKVGGAKKSDDCGAFALPEKGLGMREAALL